MGISTVGVTFGTTGLVGSGASNGDTVTNISPSSWLTGAPISGAGSLFEIRVVATDSTGFTNGTTNWRSLATPWTIQAGADASDQLEGAFSQIVGTVTIRRASNPASSASIPFDLRASVPDGGLGPGGCFIAGSKVLLASGKYINIEKLRKGHKVIGKDGVINEVVELRTINTAKQVLVSINGSNYFVTDSHPILTTSGWKAIDKNKANRIHPELSIEKLEKGDALVLFDFDKNEEYHETINSLATIEKELVVYNLNVSGKDTPNIDGNDTYIVNGLIVHNK